jgi:hypothetical protein
MATDHIRYDVLARDALRGVLRRVLSDAAEHGLPGEHHFFITFLSTADGVKLSPRLLAQYPEEMTVILQHQFWDLVVSEDRFEVGLSFGGIPERLVVPFNSIKSFLDPSVPFSVGFEPADAAADAPSAVGATHPLAPLSTGAPAPANPAPTALPAPADSAATGSQDEPTRPNEGAEVVRLDRFRKK